VARGTATERHRLVDEHMPYVRGIAAKVKSELRTPVELDDLVAYGAQGLLEAASRFDGRQASFQTFAYYRIKGAIFDGLRRMGWLPRAEYARARLDEHASDYLAAVAAREAPSDGEERPLEDELRDLSSALGGMAAVLLASLAESPESPGESAKESAKESDLEPLDETPPAEERLERGRAARTVREVLETMPERERRLIELHYFDELPLAEAGARLGLSKSWASRLHARAIDHLAAGLARRNAEPSAKPRARRPR
jgi:RNA polymerase sigma factor for flagellar operon FliA